MTRIVEVLLDTFNHEAKQARVVLEAAKGMDLDYTPEVGMRTLKDLANHLAQIPSLDPCMYAKEISTIDEAQAKEKELNRDEIDKMLEVFEKGIKQVNERFKNVSDDEMTKKNLKPFYEQDDERSWTYYMPEFITHIAMHKMQLWMYLKLSGAQVNMMTYYGVTSE